MSIWLVLLLLIVAVVGAVFEPRARRLGWRSVARDFLAVIGAIALVILGILILVFFILARGGAY